MSSKVLLTEPSRCTGCRTCEMACSLYHEGRCSPVLSRTRVIKFESLGKNFPTICAHCSKPQCMDACQKGAISHSPDTGAVVIDEELCTGCRSCVLACPHSQIGYNHEKKVAFKCDLCGGKPQCARFCPTGAIAFRDVDEYLMARRRAMVSKAVQAGS